MRLRIWQRMAVGPTMHRRRFPAEELPLKENMPRLLEFFDHWENGQVVVLGARDFPYRKTELEREVCD